MARLPVSRVETPGCRENWDEVQNKSLLPGLGDPKLISSGAIPDGWVVADGSALSRSRYRDLFLEIGITYGPGDGSTTFNVPDMAGTEPVAAQTWVVRAK